MKTPLDTIMTEFELSNHDLVVQLPGHLSHKTVQKARLGTRPLSRTMQVQVTEALNKAILPEHPYKREFLFPNNKTSLESST